MPSASDQNIHFVTGASSGIGRAYTEVASKRGELVIATARNLQSVKDLESDSIKILELDVTKAPKDLAAQAERLFGRAPNVLFNNAGYGLSGVVEEVSDEDLRRQFDANFFGLIDVMRLLLPGIRQYGERGWVLSNTSMGAWYTSAGFSPYQATKHALGSVSRSLAEELKPFGTHVMAIEIGLARTGFFSDNQNTGRAAGWQMAKKQIGSKEYDQQRKNRIERFEKFAGNEPSDANKIGERLMDIIRNEGAAKGKKAPLELPLGQEGFKAIRDVLEKKTAEMDEWEAFGSDVKFD